MDEKKRNAKAGEKTSKKVSKKERADRKGPVGIADIEAHAVRIEDLAGEVRCLKTLIAKSGCDTVTVDGVTKCARGINTVLEFCANVEAACDRLEKHKQLESKKVQV